MVAGVLSGQKIGDISKSTGLTIKAIRFYCDEGLIKPIGRTEGKYRLFDANCETELTLIKTLRGMDIPLAEIRDFLQARRSGQCKCEKLQGRMKRKVLEINSKINELRILQGEIQKMAENWQECGGTKENFIQ